MVRLLPGSPLPFRCFSNREEDRLEVVLQELASFGFVAGHNDFWKSAVPDIVIERGHDTAPGRGADGCRGERNVSVSKVFPEREWQHQDILVPPAEFRRYLTAKQL